MNILVCIKQTPDTERGCPDYIENSGRIDRSSADRVINVFDSYALEIASRLRDACPGSSITALTLGPEPAVAVLKEALSISADKAFHICSEAFSGLDAPASARVLSEAIRRIEDTDGEFDVIFCGKASADGETSVVPAGMSELLGRAFVSGCCEVSADGGAITAKREVKGGCEIISAPSPCIISCVKPEGSFKFPTIKRKMAANRAVIPIIDDTAVHTDTASAISVLRVYAPERSSSCIFIKCESDEESTAELAKLISAGNLI